MKEAVRNDKKPHSSTSDGGQKNFHYRWGKNDFLDGTIVLATEASMTKLIILDRT